MLIIRGTCRAEQANLPPTIRLRGLDRPAPALSKAQYTSYHKDGYLVIPDALTAEHTVELLDHARDMMRLVSAGGTGITRHSLLGGKAESVTPVGRIIATFEPGDKSTSDPFKRRVARLGCSVHSRPPFESMTHSAFHRSIAQSLGYSDARITQSQIIAKLADVGGEIIPHQDGCVSFTDPPSALTFWYALEDTTLENGCLCVAQGSHLTSPLRERLVKEDDGLPKMEELAQPLWLESSPEFGIESQAHKDEYEYQALEVKQGTLILFNGNLMHKSGGNQSRKDRIAYSFSVVEGKAKGLTDSYMMPESGTFETL
ncbi:MAG: hypothetical protein Q9166_001108 [cf. Caloplaca sp. 2 TL-2023]